MSSEKYFSNIFNWKSKRTLSFPSCSSSRVPSSNCHTAFSPVSHLTFDLSELSTQELVKTPKRQLALSDIENTPEDTFSGKKSDIYRRSRAAKDSSFKCSCESKAKEVLDCAKSNCVNKENHGTCSLIYSRNKKQKNSDEIFTTCTGNGGGKISHDEPFRQILRDFSTDKDIYGKSPFLASTDRNYCDRTRWSGLNINVRKDRHSSSSEMFDSQTIKTLDEEAPGFCNFGNNFTNGVEHRSLFKESENLCDGKISYGLRDGWNNDDCSQDSGVGVDTGAPCSVSSICCDITCFHRPSSVDDKTAASAPTDHLSGSSHSYNNSISSPEYPFVNPHSASSRDINLFSGIELQSNVVCKSEQFISKLQETTENSVDVYKDDGFIDIKEDISRECNEPFKLPDTYLSLFTAPVLKETPTSSRASSKPKTKACRRLLAQPVAMTMNQCCPKRSNSIDSENATVQIKRKCSVPVSSSPFFDDNVLLKPKSQLKRSNSESVIKSLLSKVCDNPNLIGDGSKPYLLPMTKGRHSDLRSITCDTLSTLITKSQKEVEKCIIVDCRYPYEFAAGHIVGAWNLYHKEDVLNEFLRNPILTSNPEKRVLLIFHCEFSAERAPNLSRFLRNMDRDANRDNYPELYYPELYLLEGGYKRFYENYSQLCEPRAYLPMLHENHRSDLIFYQLQTHSWVEKKNKKSLHL